MTDTAISPLRQRMIEDMKIRGFAEKTQMGYLRAVSDFAVFLGRAPDGAETEDLRRYQLHMRSRGASATSMNAAVSALTHHPHLHCVVPGGGISRDGTQWISCRPGFFLPVRVLSRLFRRLFLEKLVAAHEAGRLKFFGDLRHLAETHAFDGHLRPLRKVEWVVYAKRPFAGPQAVLAYLSRYTHRVAIANSRLISLDEGGVTFKWKDYRAKGRMRRKTMTLPIDEFIRRFLIHVLPSGFHRIRYYGLLANGGRAKNLIRARQLLDVPVSLDEPDDTAESDEPPMLALPCPCCGGPMVIIETFERGAQPRAPPSRLRTGSP